MLVLEKFAGLQNLRIISLILGGLSVLGLPPFFHYEIAFLAFAAMFFLLENASLRAGFLSGFLFGFGHFLASLFWVSHSLNFTPHLSFLRPLFIFGLPLIPSLIVGLVFLLHLSIIHKLKITKHWKKAVLFSVIWTLGEMLKEHLTSFPWNPVGHMLLETNLLQLASIFGVFGLSLIFLLFCSFPFILAEKNLVISGTYGLCLAILFGWGSFLNHSPIIADFSKEKAAVIQANVPQETKWNPELMISNIQKHIALSAKTDVKLLIWPESSVNFNDDHVMEMIATGLNEQFLIAGKIRLTKNEIFNSAILVDEKGKFLGQYDKRILVPFGEFVPFRKFLPINKLTEGTIDISPGANLQESLHWKEFDFKSSICYEAAFSLGKIPQNSGKFKEILVNLTNDAWFGDSIGPHQHLHHFRMRAVENGSFAIRAANSGISAFISPKGEILQSTNLLTEEKMIINLPMQKNTQSFYSKFGILPLFLIMLIMAYFATRNSKRPKI